MKELTIEQKAQRYDKALAKARTIVNSINVGLIGKDSFEAVFPELKENKEESTDEKVRKALIKLVTNHASMDLFIEYDIHLDEALSWLEKQGKQKPADKIEPKFNFKDGQWIVATGKCTYLITKIDGFNVTLVDVKGNEYVFDTSSLEDAHLWNIRDAKDGDVVIDKSDGAIGIFQSIGHHPNGGSYNDPSYCFLHCRYDDGFFYADFEHGNTIDSDDLIPATKEQRDTLMKAMADAGYTFDFEKRELKKIEQKSVDKVEPKFKVRDFVKNTNYQGEPIYEIVYIDKECYICEYRGKENMGDKTVMHFAFDNPYLRLVEQNPAWSEEDDEHLERILKELENQCQRPINSPYLDKIESDYNWLKYLKDKVQLKQEWSEKDKHMLQKVIDFMKHPDLIKATPTLSKSTINWLEFLEERYTWKPSRDQMNALDIAIRCGIQLGSWEEKSLKSLREQLFKL